MWPELPNTFPSGHATATLASDTGLLPGSRRAPRAPQIGSHAARTSRRSTGLIAPPPRAATRVAADRWPTTAADHRRATTAVGRPPPSATRTAHHRCATTAVARIREAPEARLHEAAR